MPTWAKSEKTAAARLKPFGGEQAINNSQIVINGSRSVLARGSSVIRRGLRVITSEWSVIFRDWRLLVRYRNTIIRSYVSISPGVEPAASPTAAPSTSAGAVRDTPYDETASTKPNQSVGETCNSTHVKGAGAEFQVTHVDFAHTDRDPFRVSE